MSNQEYVTLFFKRETADRFHSIRQELGFGDNALLEHFFNLYEKNKVTIGVQDVEISTTCEPEISHNLDQYRAIVDTLDELRDELVDNDETARALVSLQDAIGATDDDAPEEEEEEEENPVAPEEDHRIIRNLIPYEEEAGEGVEKEEEREEEDNEETDNIEIQLIEGANVEIDFCSVPELSPSTQQAENVQETSEKTDQSQSEQGSDSDEFLNKILEPEGGENPGKRSIESSESGKMERKRKRRNDVWLTRTQDTDFGERRYKCNLCSAAFFHPHHLQRHEKTLHKLGKQMKPNQCEDCFKTFATPLTHKYHKDYACKMIQRPYRCPECRLGFKTTENVNEHKCSGDPAKPLCCMDCHYRTGSPRDLEHHHRIHTGERCYKCELCNFQTAWKKNLKEHILKHSGLKPFACNMCSFASNDRSNLRTHLAKHLKNLKDAVDKCEGCKPTLTLTHSSESHTLHSYATPPKSVDCNRKSKFSLESPTRNNQNVKAGKLPTESHLTTDSDGDNTLPMTTINTDMGRVVQRSYICFKCGFFNNNKKLYETHKCKNANSSETINPSGETVIEIIESSDELATVEI